MAETLDAEVERNLFAFLPRIPALMKTHAGEYALLRKQEVVSLHARLSEALSEGEAKFADGLFSIQQVTDKPVELGFYSYAGHQG
jgi:hypothetical protein